MRRLFASLDGTGIEDAEQRATELDELLALLEAHERAEERTLYEATGAEPSLRELALEGLEQHRISRTLLAELGAVSVADERWLPKLRAARGLVENHMLVEEGLVLPSARDLLGPEAMAGLAERFKAHAEQPAMARASRAAHP